jgi:carbamoyl-phosphate synthase large subunit
VPVLPVKVLVTGAGALLGQGIIRSLERSSLQVEIAAADPNPLSAGLFWAHEANLIPMATAPDYLERLGEVLARVQPAILIPGTDVELPILAAHRERLEKEFGTRVLVSDPRVVAIADDKFLTYQFLKEAGLAPPASALPEDADAIDALVKEVGFPLIVKPRIGARSVGVSRVSTPGELDDALTGREGLVVQECVAGDDAEYTASVLVFDGEPQASIVMRRDLRDGNTYRAFPGPYPELNLQVKALGAALQPYGPANFQFRLDRDGRARVFEINGRFSGTTPLRALVGFNEVEMCLRHILFGEPIVQPPVHEATVLRFWSEILVEQSEVEALR